MNGEDPIALGLPHREPFIFVDAVTQRVPGLSAESTKVFPLNTPFFAGHFPGTPIVPGVILAEALAQTAGLAAGEDGRSFRLTAIKGMKFPAPAFPDQEIRMSAKCTAVIGALWQFEVRAVTGEQTVAEGVVVLSEASAGPG